MLEQVPAGEPLTVEQRLPASSLSALLEGGFVIPLGAVIDRAAGEHFALLGRDSFHTVHPDWCVDGPACPYADFTYDMACNDEFTDGLYYLYIMDPNTYIEWLNLTAFDEFKRNFRATP